MLWRSDISVIIINWTVCCLWRLKSYSHCPPPPSQQCKPPSHSSHMFLHPQGFTLLRTLHEKFTYTYAQLSPKHLCSSKVTGSEYDLKLLISGSSCNKWNSRSSQQWILQTVVFGDVAMHSLVNGYLRVTGNCCIDNEEDYFSPGSSQMLVPTHLQDYMVSHSRTALS